MSEPTRRDRTRPVELIVLSAIVALVVGVISLFATRDIMTAGIFFGVAFIVSLVGFAMFLLAVPSTDDGETMDDDAGADGDAGGGDPPDAQSR